MSFAWLIDYALQGGWRLALAMGAGLALGLVLMRLYAGLVLIPHAVDVAEAEWRAAAAQAAQEAVERGARDRRRYEGEAENLPGPDLWRGIGEGEP